ncbi:hypothetical protein [Streptomyces wedmorensis]
MATDPADTVSVSGVGFGDYYRAHAGPLVALSLLRGADLVEAARLAQDSMTVARLWMDLLVTNVGGGAKDTRPPVVSAQALRSWTCRMTVGGGCGVLRPAHGTVPALLGKGSTDALVQARTVVALAPLRELNERQLNVTAFRLAGCAPGAIGYELGLSMPKVHRTLRHVGKLLGAETGPRQARGAEAPGEAEGSGASGGSAEADVRSAEADARFAELLGELAAVLDPVLDLGAGLDEVSGSIGADGATARRASVPPLWNFAPSLPVPPFGAPLLHSFAEPAPSGVRAYAAGLARCDAQGREAALIGFPSVELAAVRPGADASPRSGGSLAEALTQSLSDTHRMIHELDELNSNLSRAESTLPDGYYVDMTRDFDLHQSFHADLALGIDAVREALSQP